MRVTDRQRQQAEYRIQAAMDRLLRGKIPPGGKLDLKTLAAQAGVNRTGFYPKNGVNGPYQHLAIEFNRRRELHEHNNTRGPDPREAEISRLQHENTRLRTRIAEKDSAVEDLTTFKTLAISRLAAQHDEITRLRTTAAPQANPRQSAGLGQRLATTDRPVLASFTIHRGRLVGDPDKSGAPELFESGVARQCVRPAMSASYATPVAW